MTLGRLTLLAAAAFAVGCNGESRTATLVPVVAADPNANASRMSPKDLHQHAALNGVAAGAKAGQKVVAAQSKDTRPVAVAHPLPPTAPMPPQPPAPPAIAVGHDQVVINGGKTMVVHVGQTRATEHVVAKVPARPQPAVKVKVRSDKLHQDKNRALDDALVVAQVELMKEFQKLDPPVDVKPSIAAIRNSYLKKDTVSYPEPSEEAKKELKEKVGENRVYAEIDVEVTEAQIQGLRAGERVNTGFQAGGVLFAVLLAVYGFLRLDAWTKGYLTSWLAIGAIVLVLVAVQLVIFS